MKNTILHPPFPQIVSLRQRLFVILQLCIAFSVALWYMSEPFMGQYFALRNRLLVYEFAMGISPTHPSSDQKKKIEINQSLFQELPLSEKEFIEKDFNSIQQFAARPAFQKTLEGFYTFVYDIPPFELAWIFFSITIGVCILLRKEGAKLASWLLPCLALFFSFDNYFFGRQDSHPSDYLLFPTESDLIQGNFMTKDLPLNPLEQKKILEDAWNRYLIAKWSGTLQNFQDASPELLAAAEFNFSIARLKTYHNQPYQTWLRDYHKKINPWILAAYCLWNGLFAWVMQPLFRRKDLPV